MRSELVQTMLLQQKALAAFESCLETEDLSATETLLLAELHHLGPVSPTSLAQRVGLSRGRLSHLLHRLAKKEYIIRHSNPHDGRSAQIAVDPRFKEKAAEAAARSEALWKRVSDSLGSGGQAMFSQLLEQISVSAQEDSAPH